MELLNLAIFSTAFAILANVGAYIYQRWVERRSQLKIALHILLEIWHRASIQNIEIVDPLLERIAQRLSDKLNQPIKFDDTHKAGLRYFFKRMVSTIGKDANKLNSDYDKAISLVATSDPLFAYAMGSANSILRFISGLDQFEGELTEYTSAGDGNLKLIFAPMTDMAITHVSSSVVSDLENLIRDLSKKLKWGMESKCETIMEARRKQLKDPMADPEFEEEMNNLTDMMIEEIMIAARKLDASRTNVPWYISLWQRVGNRVKL